MIYTLLRLISLSIPPNVASPAILTALDDKIELNRRMNETLEGIAQAVWGEWFGKYASGEESDLKVIGDFIKIKHGFAFKGENNSETESDNIEVTPGNFSIAATAVATRKNYDILEGRVSKNMCYVPEI